MLSNVPWAECVGAFYFLPRIVLPDLIHVATFPVPLKALFMRSYLIFKGSFGDRWWVGCRTEARLMCEGTSLAHSSIISPVEMRIFMPIGWALRRTQPDWYGWEHTHPLARSLTLSLSEQQDTGKLNIFWRRLAVQQSGAWRSHISVSDDG